MLWDVSTIIREGSTRVKGDITNSNRSVHDLNVGHADVVDEELLPAASLALANQPFLSVFPIHAISDEEYKANFRGFLCSTTPPAILLPLIAASCNLGSEHGDAGMHNDAPKTRASATHFITRFFNRHHIPSVQTALDKTARRYQFLIYCANVHHFHGSYSASFKTQRLRGNS